MQTNEQQDDTYDDTEPKNTPDDKNSKHSEKPANNHVVNPVVQSNAQTEQSDIDKETIINEIKKCDEATAQSNAFAGLFLLAELATTLLSRAEPVMTEQSPPQPNTNCSPVYEENNKSEQGKKTEETNEGNIFGNLLFLAELATALHPTPSANEPLKTRDNILEMAPFKNCRVEYEYEYVIPYIEIVEEEIDTAEVTPPHDIEFIDEIDDVEEDVDTVGPQEDTPPVPQFEYHDVEFEDFSDLVEFVGREEDVPALEDDDEDEEFEQLLHQLVHY